MVIKPAAKKKESECFMVTSMYQLFQLKKGEVFDFTLVMPLGGLGHRSFVGTRIAFAVFPSNCNFVASFSAFDGKLQEWIL
jgi:hypothetical protein